MWRSNDKVSSIFSANMEKLLFVYRYTCLVRYHWIQEKITKESRSRMLHRQSKQEKMKVLQTTADIEDNDSGNSNQVAKTLLSWRNEGLNKLYPRTRGPAKLDMHCIPDIRCRTPSGAILWEAFRKSSKSTQETRFYSIKLSKKGCVSTKTNQETEICCLRNLWAWYSEHCWLLSNTKCLQYTKAVFCAGRD